MQPIRRTAVAALAAATLSLAPLSIAEAAVHAKPSSSHSAHGGKGGGSSHHLSAQARGVLRKIVVRDRALGRVAASKAVTRLPAEQKGALVASIGEDRAALAALKDAVAAGTTKPRAAKATLRSFRVENYLQAVAVLRDVAELADAAAELPEVLELVDALVADLLTVDATGGRAVLRAARADLEDAWALYDELTAEPEGCTDDDTDGTDDGTDEGTDGVEGLDDDLSDDDGSEDCTDDGSEDGGEDGAGGSDDGTGTDDPVDEEPLG